jgi:hypothetical protein
VATAAQPLGKNGVIYACVKAKGKNKGSLRVVPSKSSCRRMRGWRPLTWSANGAGAAGQAGSQGAAGGGGQPGPEGNPGPEGKEGAAGQVEKSLVETIQSQTVQINSLTDQVANLSDDVVGLEGTVGETCDQLKTVTKQTDDVLDSLVGASIGGVLAVLNVPSPPDPLGTFECAS